MKVTRTAISDVLILEPKVFGDNRGFFLESYNSNGFAKATGLDVDFVQDNHSRSTKGVLRGLHYQIEKPQGKLVRVVRGSVLDIAVDIRRDSPTVGEWVGVLLTEDNNLQLWIPPGLAHGFLVVSETADFLYKTTQFYTPEYERCLAWNDPDINIQWQLEEYSIKEPKISAKDMIGRSFNELKNDDLQKNTDFK